MLYKGTLGTMYSGSINGLVAAHNRGGYYFRNRVVPTDPATARQVNCREALQACYTQWASVMTAAERSNWARYAESRRHTNRIGDDRQLSGWPEFSKYAFLPYQAIEQLAASVVVGTAVPLYPQPFTEIPYCTLNADNLSLDLHWNDDQWTAVDDHQGIFVYASTQRPNTRNFFKGPYKLLNVVWGDPDTAPTPPVNIPLGFTVTSGSRVFYRLRFWGADFHVGPAWPGQVTRA